jgi:hypothetical protein
MRLRVIEDAHDWPDPPPPGVVKTLLYRPELFGRPFSDVLDREMRGESEWSVGERELFAAFTSLLNQCPF